MGEVSHGAALDTNTTLVHVRHNFFRVLIFGHEKNRVRHKLRSCSMTVMMCPKTRHKIHEKKARSHFKNDFSYFIFTFATEGRVKSVFLLRGFKLTIKQEEGCLNQLGQ